MSAFRTLRALYASFTAATAFLTLIPIETPRGGWQLAASAWAFPLVGAGVGGAAALVFLMAQLIGLANWPAATLSVLAGLALTGALHEDGLADTADGFFGGRDREAKLVIMRDSRHGTFGVLALVASVLLRATALTGIGDVIHAGLALIAAHAASRAALPVVMRGLLPARSDGLGATAGKPRAFGAIAASSIGVLIALMALGPLRGFVALSLTSGTVLAMALLARRQIGGYTGDVLGALQQIGETVMLLAASSR